MTNTHPLVINCPRCQAKGWLPEFKHIKNGVCFLCSGSKIIETKTRYPSEKELVCNVAKGFVTVADENDKLVKKYREAIAVSFDGGNNFTGHIITDKNRNELKALWVFFKNNDAVMNLDTNDY